MWEKPGLEPKPAAISNRPRASLKNSQGTLRPVATCAAFKKLFLKEPCSISELSEAGFQGVIRLL